MRGPPPPIKAAKTRVFQADNFVKQKSNPPPKPPKNRTFSSKSDAAALTSNNSGKPPPVPVQSRVASHSAFSSGNQQNRPKLAKRSSFHNKPLPPGNFKGRNKKRNSGITNRPVGGDLARRLAALEAKANGSDNAFGGNYTGNDGQELADSPTDHVAGPNPLQNLPSQNQYQ